MSRFYVEYDDATSTYHVLDSKEEPPKAVAFYKTSKMAAAQALKRNKQGTTDLQNSEDYPSVANGWRFTIRRGDDYEAYAFYCEDTESSLIQKWGFGTLREAMLKAREMEKMRGKKFKKPLDILAEMAIVEDEI